jgi:hypothetical protein
MWRDVTLPYLHPLQEFKDQRPDAVKTPIHPWQPDGLIQRPPPRSPFLTYGFPSVSFQFERLRCLP